MSRGVTPQNFLRAACGGDDGESGLLDSKFSKTFGCRFHGALPNTILPRCLGPFTARALRPHVCASYYIYRALRVRADFTPTGLGEKWRDRVHPCENSEEQRRKGKEKKRDGEVVGSSGSPVRFHPTNIVEAIFEVVRGTESALGAAAAVTISSMSPSKEKALPKRRRALPALNPALAAATAAGSVVLAVASE